MLYLHQRCETRLLFSFVASCDAAVCEENVWSGRRLRRGQTTQMPRRHVPPHPPWMLRSRRPDFFSMLRFRLSQRKTMLRTTRYLKEKGIHGRRSAKRYVWTNLSRPFLESIYAIKERKLEGSRLQRMLKRPMSGVRATKMSTARRAARENTIMIHHEKSLRTVGKWISKRSD